MINPGLNLISKKYDVSLDSVNEFMIGMLAFWTGVTTFFTSSGATIWGKRPFFVLSSVLLLVTCIWGYTATVSRYSRQVTLIEANLPSSHSNLSQ
jgi:hypothetical protein